MDAKRRASLKVPATASEAGRFICINACRTEIDQVARKRAFKRTVAETAEIGVICDLHGPQVAITGKLLIESPASPAVNAAVHLVLDEDAQVLIMVGPFLAEITPDPLAACNRHILEETVPALVADGAVVGMIHHEPFNDMSAEVDRLFVCGGDDHAIAGIHHATHLDTFDRAFQKLHRAHAASAHRPETGMIAETRDDDTEPGSCLNHPHPLGDFNFETVDL
jgi:hypothetical protein